ncbi:MAG: ankyrin repeat domain-containing protein [bacterium]
MKKLAITVLAVLVIIPSITYASWWNPLTWFNNWGRGEVKKEIVTSNAIPLDQKTVNTLSKLTKDTNSFRLSAAINVDNGISSWTEKSAYDKWSTEIVPKLFETTPEKNMLRDFFSGAMVMTYNSVSQDSNIVLLYSPWADCILLLKMKFSNDKNTISDYVFVAGETWRNEKLETPEEALKFYGSDSVLDKDLVNLVSSVKKIFVDEYVNKNETKLISDGIKNGVASALEELRPPVIRLLYREQMYVNYLATSTKPLVQAANKLVDLVVAGDRNGLKSYLAPNQNQDFLNAILNLTPELRKNLVGPVYFSGNPKNGIVAFINPEYPESVLITRVIIKDGGKSDVTVFLIPLSESDKIASIMSGNNSTSTQAQTNAVIKGCQDPVLAKYKSDPELWSFYQLGFETKPEIFKSIVNDDGDKILSLIKSGAKVDEADKNGQNALMFATTLNCPYSFQTLLDNGANVNFADKKGKTVLMYAVEAKQQNMDMISLLIKNGANVDAKNTSEWTALHYAATVGNVPAINLLVKSGANINARKDSGATPLIVATLTSHVDVMKILLDLGADPLIKTSSGMSAMDYAKLAKGSSNQQGMIDLLNSYLK